MNALPFGQQYAQSPQMAYNQITRRPLNDSERELPVRVYKAIQNNLRGISMMCLVLFMFSVFIFPTLVTDEVTYDSLSILLTVFMFVLGAAAIGMSVNALTIRKRVEEAMRDGTAIEVVAPAYRTSNMQKGQAWTVGPVSVLPTRGIDGLFQQGMLTSILCVPKLKAAIAINNSGLKQGARIMFPPNLEAMAVPAAPVSPPVHLAQEAPPPAQMPQPQEAPAPQAQEPRTPSPLEEVPQAPASRSSHHRSGSKKHDSHGRKKKASARSK